MSERSWCQAGVEPALDEVLSDPIVRLLAWRDGLSAAELRRAVGQARLALCDDAGGAERVTPEELSKA